MSLETAATIQEAELQSWSMQAASDRREAIATINEARQRLRDVRALLNTVDKRLAGELAAAQHALDERLGWLLVAQQDAGS